MHVLPAVLGLLLLGCLRAFPQDRVSTEACSRTPSHYYNKAVQRCCYQCPEGQTSHEPCPQGPTGCRKQCEPDHYLSREGRCLACVTCSGGDLVEKTPCSWNASRVCQCRAGMFCSTSAANSCARCFPHSVCSPGTVIKLQGTAEKDTVCGPASPATSPDCSASAEDCLQPASGATLQAKSLQTTPASSDAKTIEEGSPPAVDDTPQMQPDSPSPKNPELASQQLCSPGSGDCRRRCELEYYLDQAGRCTACVSCSGGMAERDTAEKSPPLGVLPDCSTNPEEAVPTSSEGQARGVTHAWEDASTPTSVPISSSSTGKPIFIPEPVIFLVIVLVVGVSSCFFLYHCQLCKKWIQQKLHLCHPNPIPRPQQEPVGHPSHSAATVILAWSTYPPTVVCLALGIWQEDPRQETSSLLTGGGEQERLEALAPVPSLCPQEPKRSESAAGPGTDKLGLLSPPATETCPSVRAACPETLRLLEASPPGGSGSSSDLPETRVTSEHNNNRIEKIYIMKADTVIVGTVKTELPEGRGLVGLEEDLQVDCAPHYPEQETELPESSCGDVMFSVEEEGKDDPTPTAASEK
ncbi:tumor necrosis factor receptor superfamily member 8 [Erinaceus europaeus]|uniref:Tumor necrosis factor receptor superfamily member 8 n=1 Tax=Erinaceus europaeus TaxID=9365 RepID=A0ABM3YIQ2_ERIEU|nr:tumor necrosis factor receptor superfamily member 8 [Erinaceus europaeus]